ncbi:MAG TPA: uracil-DNA glycosylase [Capsulimonadaceae bacterium]|nr:uracil-DNA glycosylase [Capsulimonadaceae bacterium]
MTVEQAKDQKSRKIELIQQIGEKAANCTACDLHLHRTKVVFGIGNPASPLMLVGEGPGATEDTMGEPFVGRAGKLLDECLQAAGMKREHVYITNVVKCRASLEEGGRIKNRPPTPFEVGTCVPLWLEKQIEVIQPFVILCLGAPSANAIIHKNFKITQDRGKWFESRFVRYAMAALHPAFILRQEGDPFKSARQSLVDDLTAAKEKAIAAKKEPKATLF